MINDSNYLRLSNSMNILLCTGNIHNSSIVQKGKRFNDRNCWRQK